jgi:hypothetical protein
MSPAIDYQKQMTEIVYVNLPGPKEPDTGMSGGELLHGFLAALHDSPSSDVRLFVMDLCDKWNVRYRKENA